MNKFNVGDIIIRIDDNRYESNFNNNFYKITKIDSESVVLQKTTTPNMTQSTVAETVDRATFDKYTWASLEDFTYSFKPYLAILRDTEKQYALRACFFTVCLGYSMGKYIMLDTTNITDKNTGIVFKDQLFDQDKLARDEKPISASEMMSYLVSDQEKAAFKSKFTIISMLLDNPKTCAKLFAKRSSKELLIKRLGDSQIL